MAHGRAQRPQPIRQGEAGTGEAVSPAISGADEDEAL